MPQAGFELAIQCNRKGGYYNIKDFFSFALRNSVAVGETFSMQVKQEMHKMSACDDGMILLKWGSVQCSWQA